jgi:hypothetical protein
MTFLATTICSGSVSRKKSLGRNIWMPAANDGRPASNLLNDSNW